MTNQEAIKILHYAQKWRRGAKIQQPDPTTLGQAIDHAIRTLRQIERNNQVKVGSAANNPCSNPPSSTS